MSQTVAQLLVSSLARAGVRRIYGIVGDSLNPVIDAVHNSDQIDWIHVRHEEAAAFAAGAEAQLTGQITVCAGSCGPGNLHLINGLYDAHRSMAPVLAIASHIPTEEMGNHYFQETHPDQLFRECSHFCETIVSAKQMPHVLHSAMQHAISQRGVSVVVLPGDIAAQTAPKSSFDLDVFTPTPLIRPSDSELARLAELLNRSNKVTLFGGIGCADAHDEMILLAERLNAPMGYAFRGKDYLGYENPYTVGMSGLLGWGAAYQAMHECDALLLLGTDFPYDNFMPTKTVIAQVDLKPERLGRRCKLDLGFCGDIRETILELLPLLEPRTDRTFLESMLKQHQVTEQSLLADIDRGRTKTPINPVHVARTLDQLADKNAVFTADTGMSCVWAARYLNASRGRRFLGSFVHGSMANALPQAIGAQATFPNRQVISMSGDGGLTMLLGELLTIRQLDLPVKIVVFNNHSLGMVHLEMEVAGMTPFGCELKNPNFAKLAEAIGITGFRVEDPDQVRHALEHTLDEPGPALIDIVTDANVLAMPPKTTVQQAAGFALAMTKLAFSGKIDHVIDTVAANYY